MTALCQQEFWNVQICGYANVRMGIKNENI
jgi:hypothetical protein